MKKVTCVECKYLYIKDFIIGVCKNPRSKEKIVQPETSCKWGISRESAKETKLFINNICKNLCKEERAQE